MTTRTDTRSSQRRFTARMNVVLGIIGLLIMGWAAWWLPFVVVALTAVFYYGVMEGR